MAKKKAKTPSGFRCIRTCAGDVYYREGENYGEIDERLSEHFVEIDAAGATAEERAAAKAAAAQAAVEKAAAEKAAASS